MNAEQLGKQVLEAVKTYVARVVDPISSRLINVEARAATILMLLVSLRSPGEHAEMAKFIAKQLDNVDQANVFGRLCALEATRGQPAEPDPRIAQLESRIRALEQRPAGMKYVGVWRTGLGYEPGSVATYNGSMWHANVVTTAKPGTNGDWTLAVKHGKDRE
jgi:hypothetical protein